MRAEGAPFRAQFYRKNRLNFSLALLASLLTAALNLAIAWLLREMIDAVSGVTGAPGLRDLALLIAALLALIAAVKALEYYSKPRFMQRAMRQYKDFAFERLLHKNPAAFGSESSSTYISALSNDAACIEKDFLEGQFVLLSNAVLCAGALAMMLAYSPLLTLISCAFFVLPILASLFSGGLERAERRVSERNDRLTATLKDSLSGFSVIKGFRAEAAMLSLFSRSNTLAEEAKCERRRLLTAISAFAGLSGVVAQLGTFFAGAWLAHAGMELTPGALIVFIDLTASVINPIREFPGLIAARKAASALMDKLAEALSVSVRDEGVPIPERLERGIELRDLSFAYEPGREVLQGITADFAPGRSTAVVGASGSGKSTLLRLLTAGHGSYTGELLIDGRELREISGGSLCELISVVEQNVFIFNASIRDNITMFQSFPQEEVERAIELSGLAALIEERGEGYLCGENGSGLSGGEKQRISIARSLIRRSQVLLADEATAALDAASAFQVSSAILGLDCMTRIVVTHSLDAALLRRYDSILVLKGGRIEEAGTFDELMSRRGYFHSLFTVSQ